VKGKQGNITITPSPATFQGAGQDPKIYKSDSFAEEWFHDALREAGIDKDLQARRREIIFASCFAESYIFEWTRQKIQIEEIDHHFPPSPLSTLKDKWKSIPKKLFETRKIPVDPCVKLDGLGTLIKYRNGLVHASASRSVEDLPDEMKTHRRKREPEQDKKAIRPFPIKDELKKLEAGWAVKIVADLVKDLHQKIGDTAPAYIVDAPTAAKSKNRNLKR